MEEDRRASNSLCTAEQREAATEMQPHLRHSFLHYDDVPPTLMFFVYIHHVFGLLEMPSIFASRLGQWRRRHSPSSQERSLGLRN